jgi:hypothetical protein
MLINRIKKPRGPGRRFTKGKTGNPGGRPKFSKLSHALRDKLASAVPGDGRSYADVFAEILCNAGLRGDKQAIEFIATRCEGYPGQSVDVKGTSRWSPEIEAMTPEELRANIIRLLNKAKGRLDAEREHSSEEFVSSEEELPLLEAAAEEET